VRRVVGFALAASAIVAGRVWLRIAPGRAVRWATGRSSGPACARGVTWSRSIVGAGDRLHASCLERGLALVMILAMVRTPARLVIGVARPDPALRAHAWVECGGRVILGAESAADFLPISTASPCRV
jgi:hypothetical protein